MCQLKGTVRFETAPSEQLQHDWDELVSDLGGQRCTGQVLDTQGDLLRGN
jgi:hypothetical protein